MLNPSRWLKIFFDVHEPLKKIIILLNSSKTNEGNVKIIEDLKGEIFIKGDSKQIQQVFWNLGVNALDAISRGGSIFISTKRKENEVEIIFKDTGPGISRKDIDKIFYPFFTTKEKGTGLGLAIAQRITEEHGGRITAESRGAGTGATFKIILPAAGRQAC